MEWPVLDVDSGWPESGSGLPFLVKAGLEHTFDQRVWPAGLDASPRGWAFLRMGVEVLP